MGGPKQQQLTVIAAALALAFGSGCATTDSAKAPVAQKPDVTQPGVLPPPQAMTQTAATAAPNGAVVQAGGTQPVAAPASSMLAKLTARTEKKVPATEMAVGWRNRIEYLPDPSRNGAAGAGLVGQLFLYGGPKSEFALADGVLTVDLIDETPRPAGQPAATAERWQFDKDTLRKLIVNDETFGKSYALFLPWPAYKPDITKVRISARYDPGNGHTLYAEPTALSIDTVTRQWDVSRKTVPAGSQAQMGFGLTPASGNVPFTSGAPIPLGGPASGAPIPLGGAMPNAAPPMLPLPAASGAPIPLGNMAPGGAMMPLTPNTVLPIAPPAPSAGGPTAGAVPAGVAPVEPLQPLAIVVGGRP